ncbi:MAG TPA: hypothetical protein DER01_02205 [Phycisphaerales bacterium]|nr:hypothetical protein [Phycisphaerales bacterium]
MTDNDPQYTYRQSILTKPWTFGLKNNALTWEEEGKPLRMIPFTQITKVQPKFDPTRVQLNRHILHVHTTQNGIIKIASMTYQGINDFKDQASSYRTFIKAFHEQLSAANPKMQFSKGITQLGYLASIGVLIFLIVLLVGAVGFILMGAVNFIILIKLGLLLYFIPSLVGYIRKNKPGTYDPLNLPADILP